jgi:hypothetical protein
MDDSLVLEHSTNKTFSYLPNKCGKRRLIIFLVIATFLEPSITEYVSFTFLVHKHKNFIRIPNRAALYFDEQIEYGIKILLTFTRCGIQIESCSLYKDVVEDAD